MASGMRPVFSLAHHPATSRSRSSPPLVIKLSRGALSLKAMTVRSCFLRELNSLPAGAHF
jgi:hypothetical protein